MTLEVNESEEIRLFMENGDEYVIENDGFIAAIVGDLADLVEVPITEELVHHELLDGTFSLDLHSTLGYVSFYFDGSRPVMYNA